MWLDLVVVTVVVTGMFSLYFQLQFSKIRNVLKFEYLTSQFHNFSRSIQYVWLPILVLFFVAKQKAKKLSIITSRIDSIIVQPTGGPR